jgi:hypothetical protein
MYGKHIYQQREGMGLIEYQVMPSLHDIARDGWLCTFTDRHDLNQTRKLLLFL